MSLTVGKMQKYLEEKYKRTKPEELKNTQRYFLKLIEEVGELAEVIIKNKRMEDRYNRRIIIRCFILCFDDCKYI